MKYSINDTVSCKILISSIVSPESTDFDTELKFKIIGLDYISNKYLLEVPEYYSIKNSFRIKEEQMALYDISPIYLDYKTVLVAESYLRKIGKPSGRDGVFCGKCGEFYPMAEPNQPDGGMICFSCRSNPWR